MLQHDWDLYFLRIAREVSKNSKCQSRKIGAVLVKDKSIVSTGYNGPAKGCTNCDERPLEFYRKIDSQLTIDKDYYQTSCPRRNFGFKSGKGLHLCQAGHAERNALIQAGRYGIATDKATLYGYCGQVCKDCAIEIINAGITRLVFLAGSPYDSYAETILKESGIEVCQIDESEL